MKELKTENRINNEFYDQLTSINSEEYTMFPYVEGENLKFEKKPECHYHVW